jgi:hypothetical protein
MEGEVRVTVIATGFDKQVTGEAASRSAGILSFPSHQRATPPVTSPSKPEAQRVSSSSDSGTDIPEMEIPTFIRRQMD